MTTEEKLDKIDNTLDLVLSIVQRHEKQFEQIDKRFEQMEKRFEQVDKRFEQVDKRFEQIDKRFDRTDTELSEVKYDLRMDSRKLDEVYEARKKVEVSFSKAFVGGHAVFTAFIAIIVSLFTSSHT